MLAAVFALITASACATADAVEQPPRVVQPGAPGEASRVVTDPVRAKDLPYTDADVAFMQGMIGHHAQALEMTALLATRTASDDMKLLARRIEISQADEIGMMQRWLEVRGRAVPGEHAHHAPGATLMPGMLTPAEMAELAAARGPEFDRLFLQFMIKHHEGALIMVRDLFAQVGAAQQGEIFAFASDVEADQSIEIRRMQQMLGAGR